MRSWTRGYYAEGRCLALGSVIALGNLGADVPDVAEAIPASLLLVVFAPLPGWAGADVSPRSEEFTGSLDAARAVVDKWAAAALGDALSAGSSGAWMEVDALPRLEN